VSKLSEELALKVKSNLKSRYSSTFLITPAKTPLLFKQVYLWLVAVPSEHTRNDPVSSCFPAIEKNLPGIELTQYVWSLIHTFVPKNISPDATKISVSDVITMVDNALSGRDPKLLASLDTFVAKAKSRIANL
jgi:hypothetical protein